MTVGSGGGGGGGKLIAAVVVAAAFFGLRTTTVELLPFRYVVAPLSLSLSLYIPRAGLLPLSMASSAWLLLVGGVPPPPPPFSCS